MGCAPRFVWTGKMPETTGYFELSRQLQRMGRAAGGKALRQALVFAALPARNEAKRAAPVAGPPYTYAYKGRVRTFDPYPKKTYKGRYVAPGFTSRNVRYRSYLSQEGNTAFVEIGVSKEAFYSLQFLELGTSRIPKRPWLIPALDRSIPQVRERLGRRLKVLIDRAAR